MKVLRTRCPVIRHVRLIIIALEYIHVCFVCVCVYESLVVLARIYIVCVSLNKSLNL